jgi:hypothetical protein
MRVYVLRGVVLAVVHLIVRVLVGFGVDSWPLLNWPFRWTSLAIVVVIAAWWGAVDGRRNRLNDELGRGTDLTMIWLKAGIVGAVVAGAASWAVGKIPTSNTGAGSLLFEMTSGAGWTFLLIFVPAVVGTAAGPMVRPRSRISPAVQR